MKKKMIFWTLLGIGILVVIGGLIIAGNLIKIPYTTTETYWAKEPQEVTKTYIEQETYTTTETYYEEVPCVKDIPLSYEVLEEKYSDNFWGTSCNVWVKLKNIDNQAGSFWVEFDVTTTIGSSSTSTNPKYLRSGESYTFNRKFDGKYQDSSYKVHTTTKSEVEMCKVEKERTVVKKRPVTKSKPEVEYKDVQKTKDVVKHQSLFNSWGICKTLSLLCF